MRNWFVVSFAVMAFIVACGKKDKKQGEIGKTTKAEALGCKEKDGSCKREVPVGTPEAAKPSVIDPSGAQEAKVRTSFMPNLKNAEIMSLFLDDNKALISNLSIKAVNEKPESVDEFSTVRVSCAAPDTPEKDLITIDPDDLKTAASDIRLLSNSKMLTLMNFKNGEADTGAKEATKPYLIYCKNQNKVNLEDFEKNEKYHVKSLGEGMYVLDLISTNSEKTAGEIISIQCVSDENLLSVAKKLSSENQVMNRIKLGKGSAIYFARAINKKELSVDLKDSEKRKENVLVTCK